MRVRALDINEITYEYKDYSMDLYNSIKRIGFSFPIHVRMEDNQFVCIDGHKRLSVLHDLLLEKDNKRRSLVNVIIQNNGDKRSNDCSRGRNTH